MKWMMDGEQIQMLMMSDLIKGREGYLIQLNLITSKSLFQVDYLKVALDPEPLSKSAIIPHKFSKKRKKKSLYELKR